MRRLEYLIELPVGAQGVLREAGNRYIAEQESKNRIRGARKRRSEGRDGGGAAREAFYPAPNKTHKPKASLRQGHGVTFAASGYPQSGAGVGAGGMSLDDLLGPTPDAVAQRAHLQERVADLTRTVDELR